MGLDSGSPIVLVVEDSPDSLGMINTALNQAGYVVLVSLNGRQALDIVAQIQPHVVLMDAVMPVMDGFECCSEMRKRLPSTPIIFMTGLSDEEHVVKAFNSGGNDYITKPIKPAELLARISAHLNSAKMINNAHAALDVAKQFVLAVDDRGEILWTTPDTRDLLKRHGLDCEASHGVLSQRLLSWLRDHQTASDVVVSAAERPVILRYFKNIGDGEHLLRVVGQDLLTDASVLEAALPVTKREAEVLLWVAQGKTNKEIGEILSLSPRTVNKHLEQSFRKLQVDNRSAATSIAIQVLLGRL